MKCHKRKKNIIMNVYLDIYIYIFIQKYTSRLAFVCFCTISSGKKMSIEIRQRKRREHVNYVCVE